MNKIQNNPAFPTQAKVPVRSKGLLAPILLIVLPTPLWILSMLVMQSEAIASLSTEPTSWLTVLLYIICLPLMAATFLLPLAIPPCIAIGIGQLIKRRRLLAKNPQVESITDTLSPSLAPEQKKGTPWSVLIMIILWVVVPIGFFFAWFAEGYSDGLNDCTSASSQGSCQPSHLGIYFIVWLIVAGAITTYSTVKK